MITPDTPLPPRAGEILRQLLAAAGEAGFEDHAFGAVVIAARAFARLEEEASLARHPRNGSAAGSDVG